MKRDKKIRLIEFIIIGVAFGIIEDIIAILVTTDESISLEMVLIVIIIALPFAYISEIIVDHPRFWEKIIPRKEIKDTPQK